MEITSCKDAETLFDDWANVDPRKSALLDFRYERVIAVLYAIMRSFKMYTSLSQFSM